MYGNARNSIRKNGRNYFKPRLSLHIHRETSRGAKFEFIVSAENWRKWCFCSHLVFGEIKSPNLYAMKFDGLLVNDNKIIMI